MNPEQIKVVLATDCGSTTSKARFFKKIGEEYRFVESGEAPTTVEAPFEDVKFVYDAVGAALRPLGLILDYDHIKTTRPKIAEMLK